MLVKCQFCGNKGNKTNMNVTSKETGKLLKSGKPQLKHTYLHTECVEAAEKDKTFKQEELKQFDELYQYLLKLHDVSTFSGREIKKLQDLRNGTISIRGKSVTRYKQGVPYTLMLSSYLYAKNNINWSINNKQFETKFNEFAYCFGIMTSSIAEVEGIEKRKQQQEKLIMKATETIVDIDIVAVKKSIKKDDTDISEFL